MLLRTLTLNPVEPRAKSASCLGKGLAEQNVLPHCGVENPGLLWRKGDWLLPGDLPSHERIREFEIRLSSHWYSIYSFLSKDQSSLRFLIYSFQWKDERALRDLDFSISHLGRSWSLLVRHLAFNIWKERVAKCRANAIDIDIIQEQAWNEEITNHIY